MPSDADGIALALLSGLMPSRQTFGARLLIASTIVSVWAAPLSAEDLSALLGRNETRIYAESYRLEPGVRVSASGLPERLDRLGYRRVHRRPQRPGEYFWGIDRFWVYRRPFAVGRRDLEAELILLELDRDGTRVVRLSGPEREPIRHPRLEPELLAEGWSPNRALALPVALEDLPPTVWRAVLAAEDARFFDHVGLDGRALARALLANAKAGKIVQGGSTITQQLIKLRDLTPRRSAGRKLSEAIRALALEADHEKEEILEAYLNSVYFGHQEGVHLYGIGRAARTYFGVAAAELDLPQAAALAAMVQGPNRLHPIRNPSTLRPRWEWVLSRMDELGWADRSAVRSALRRGLPPPRPRSPGPPPAAHFRVWLRERVEAEAPRRLARGRGVVVHTTLDLGLQRAAEGAVAEGLEEIRRRRGGSDLAAALVAMDSASGAVLAYVGGDPASIGAGFDRARQGRRQPGSAVKPFVLLEAFEECGGRSALFPSRRVSDRPVEVSLESGTWRPRNPDGRQRESVTLRRSLVLSLNVPFVRVGRWCGWEPTADRFRRAGLPVSSPLAPAFVLGAGEVSPLELVSAYTLFANGGRRVEPRIWSRISRPSGRGLDRGKVRSRRVSGEAAAYLALDLMREVVERGTGSAANPGTGRAWGKTGTSSEGRDAWMVGGSGRLVAVVWVGSDSGGVEGLVGGREAASIWREFMKSADLDLRGSIARPRQVVERWVEESTGLVVRAPREGARKELFRRGSEPPSRRLLRRDEPLPVLE